jgi:hypothetical protein
MHISNTIVIDFPDGVPKGDPHGCKWTLHITRENNSSHLLFALHWGGKIEPTHFGVHPIDEFLKALNPLTGPQVST